MTACVCKCVIACVYVFVVGEGACDGKVWGGCVCVWVGGLVGGRCKGWGKV